MVTYMYFPLSVWLCVALYERGIMYAQVVLAMPSSASRTVKVLQSVVLAR